jgi:hypothetical protein
MRREGKHPLSKVPHLGDPELDSPPSLNPTSGPISDPISEPISDPITDTLLDTASHPISVPILNPLNPVLNPIFYPISGLISEPLTSVENSTLSIPDIKNGTKGHLKGGGDGQNEGETDQEYLVRTCKFCREQKDSQELERLLHCDGIWLHALRYQGKS